MPLKAKAWKISLEKGNNTCVYRMEVVVTGKIQYNNIEKSLPDWKDAGYAFNSRTGEERFYFTRDFGNTERWMEWAKSFRGFSLIELDKNGNAKKYVKLGPSDTQIKPEITNIKQEKEVLTSGRRCGKCGESGHNARTCKSAYRKTESQEVKVVFSHVEKQGEVGKRKCGKCGGIGHNMRTCKN